MAGLDGCGRLDITEMSPDTIVAMGNMVWVKGEVEEKIWIYKKLPYTVIKFDQACYAKKCNDRDPIPNALLMGVDNLNVLDQCNNANDSDNGYDTLDSGYQRKAKSIRDSTVNPANKNNLITASSSVDMRAINHIGYQPTAVIPSAAVIPMRSNTKCYGPYASTNFGNSCGGTQVETNTDLSPWVFGSIASMNNAGETLVNSMAIGLNKAETGAITIPGLPLDTFTELGATLGSGGAMLSSMNFSYGSGGITTSYEFRTYTPKFGGLNRHLIDRVKDISKNRTEQLKFLRNQQILINKTGRQITRFNQRFPKKNNRGPNNAASLGRILIGEIYDWQNKGQRTIVGVDKLHNSVSEMVYDFNKKAYMSWDGLFGPISKSGDGGLPQYANFAVDCHKASPIAPQPPFATSENYDTNPFINGLDQYNLEITQKYTDPLTNNFSENNHHHTGKGRGHVIDVVGGGAEVPAEGLITNFYKPDDENRYDDDYRFLGLRGPILLHSWGYDTNGKPIPNEADTEKDTKHGTFTDTNLKDKFLNDWLGKPATWPVAPIDFRFDRKRGLWVTPPGYKVVVAILDEKLEAYGSAKGSLINKDEDNNLQFGPPLYDKNGKEVKADGKQDDKDPNAKIKIVDRIGKSYNSKTKVYCYYDTFKCEYIILEAASKTAVRFRLIDICEYAPAQADYGDDWTKYAGYGDKFPNNHILGIRINCEGDPIDNLGKLIDHEDIVNIEKHKDFLINLYDTCGEFGSAYAYYNLNGGQEAFNQWKQEAATGFALLCDPIPENTCILGQQTTQCSTINTIYDSYDIVFLDSYARFVECQLTQKLYDTYENANNKYPDDDYKNNRLEGNAAAYITEFYGHTPNGMRPKFAKLDGNGLREIDFRVFDPFEGAPKGRNPFFNLDVNDKVLAVFDEKRKKYVIYNALKDDEKIIKFALIDNKDIGDRISRAVLVDIEGYPIDENGTRLTANNFQQNWIFVFDPFAIHGYTEPVPKYHNFGTTGFGPALGSDKFNEHLNGIVLEGGDTKPPRLPGNDPTYLWKGGPFIGFAIRRKMGNDVTSTLKAYNQDNEIFFLEHFADIVEGKIASTDPRINKTYYLGMLNNKNGKDGFVNGRIPFTRFPIAEDNRCNLRVRYPIDQNYAGKYITGGFVDNYTEYNKGYDGVDGCKFLAKFDHVNSKVNDGKGEKLFYTIIEVENIANRVKTVLTTKERSDELNKDKVREKSSSSEGIISQYMDGFFWDKEKSKTRYELTTIYNRYDWANKALITQWKNQEDLHIHSSLAGYDPITGAVSYQVEHAGTIAQVAEAKVPSDLAGRYGLPDGVPVPDDKKIGKFTTPLFYHGLSPLNPGLEGEELAIADQPTIDVNNPWMTYEGSSIVSLWNEKASSKIEEAQYRVIYAREAPVIITGIAQTDFKPYKRENIGIYMQYSSCPGSSQNPIPDLLLKVKNPMGYGALAGDFVTVQRVNLQTIENEANYYYMVIGTGKPPS